MRYQYSVFFNSDGSRSVAVVIKQKKKYPRIRKYEDVSWWSIFRLIVVLGNHDHTVYPSTSGWGAFLNRKRKKRTRKQATT